MYVENSCYLRLIRVGKGYLKFTNYLSKLFIDQYSKRSYSQCKKSVNAFSFNLVNIVYNNLDTLLFPSKEEHFTDIIIDGRNVSTGIGYRSTIKIRDLLIKEGIIVWTKGYKIDEDNKASGYIELTDKGREIILSMVDLDKVNIKPLTSGLILKDKDGNHIEFKRSGEAKEMLNVIKDYNDFMNTFEVSGATLDRYSGVLELVYNINTNIKRVFLRGDKEFNHYGRFHYDGVSVQSIKSHERQFLQIDNKWLKEIDYKSLHPAILYAKEGYSIEDGRDLYSIDIIDNVDLYIDHLAEYRELYNPNYEPTRNFIKTFTLILLNAKTKTKAIQAMRKKYNEDEDKRDLDRKFYSIIDPDYEAILNKIINHNKEIGKYFCSDAGIKLMNLDSKIMECIIKVFLKHKKPLLCVHDSILVWEDDVEWAKEVMSEAYEEVVGSKLNCKLEVVERD